MGNSAGNSAEKDGNPLKGSSLNTLLEPLGITAPSSATIKASEEEINTMLTELKTTNIPLGAKYTTQQQYQDTFSQVYKCYPMKMKGDKPRGRALVVTMTGNRPGWRADVWALHRMFLYIDVIPDYKFDLSGQELLQALTSFASSTENSMIDCLFVALMGHGGTIGNKRSANRNKEYLQTEDGKGFLVKDGLPQIFDNQQHPHLIDKPKVFIIQMCRGAAADSGAEIRRRHGNTESDSSNPRTSSFSDYLVCYGTQPGLLSYRDKIRGSWFIQELSKVFLEQAAERQVEDMLKMVNQRLLDVAGQEGNREIIQVGVCEASLLAPLFLFPRKTIKSWTSFCSKQSTNQCHQAMGSSAALSTPVLELDVPAADMNYHAHTCVLGLPDHRALLGTCIFFKTADCSWSFLQ